MRKIDEINYYKLFKLSIIAKIYKVETANGKRDTLTYTHLEPMLGDHQRHGLSGGLFHYI
jgi:hypothetical protein